MKLKELLTNPKLQDILYKMFEFAGIDKDTAGNIDIQSNDWYSNNTWTEVQQDKFIIWLNDVLYTDKQYRKAIMNMPVKNKKIIEKTVDQFILYYGLKIRSK